MINFFKNLTVEIFLDSISIAFVLAGGVFALTRWYAEIKTKRAKFMEKIYLRSRIDKEMAETMYKIDYDYTWYDESFHGNRTGLEYSVDKLLSFFDYICYLKKIRTITKNEFVVIQYRIIRIFNSPCVQSYLWNLYHFSKKNKADCSFKHLIDYGLIKGSIDKTEFNNPESKKYKKRLNFSGEMNYGKKTAS